MRPVPNHHAIDPPDYTGSIREAWDVVKEYNDISLWCDSNNGGVWVCEIKGEYGEAETAPLAICRAALLATLPHD